MKELETIRKRSAEVMGDYPKKRSELNNQIFEAEENMQKAKAAQDAAEDMDAYDKATDDLKRADRQSKFARAALQKLDSAPRMEEKEYSRAVDTCKHVMAEAVIEYRAAADRLMDQLHTARKKYLEKAREVNNTLTALDAAANILQTKYPVRVIEVQGEQDLEIADSNEWLRHAVRYFENDAYSMAIESDQDAQKVDKVRSAAWSAVSKGFPRGLPPMSPMV